MKIYEKQTEAKFRDMTKIWVFGFRKNSDFLNSVFSIFRELFRDILLTLVYAFTRRESHPPSLCKCYSFQKDPPPPPILFMSRF
jgi:hypothetical protein